MFLMWGYDGETFEDIEATVEHVKETNPDVFFTTVSYPIRNTGYFEKVKDRVVLDKAWEEAGDRDYRIRGPPVAGLLHGRGHLAPERRRRLPALGGGAGGRGREARDRGEGPRRARRALLEPRRPRRDGRRALVPLRGARGLLRRDVHALAHRDADAPGGLAASRRGLPRSRPASSSSAAARERTPSTSRGEAFRSSRPTPPRGWSPRPAPRPSGRAWRSA